MTSRTPLDYEYLNIADPTIHSAEPFECECGDSTRVGSHRKSGCYVEPPKPAPVPMVEDLPVRSLWNAVRSLERDLARCTEWRDQNAQGSASFAFHNQAVRQCVTDIEAIKFLLESAAIQSARTGESNENINLY